MNTVYENLEQRMAHGYIDMFPTFTPDENAPVSTAEQEKFYNLIKSLYKLAYDEPSLFVSKLHEDDVYPHRFMKAYGKPKLKNEMRKFTKSVDALLQAMFLIGKGEEVELNNKQKLVLSKLGIDELTKLPDAWVWMSMREGANIIKFTRCLFNENYSYTSEIYGRLLGDEAFKKLEKWMLEKGYKRLDSYNLIASDSKLSLTIYNPKWSEELPRGGFEYKIRHSGISMQYEDFIATPTIIGLCIPNGMKQYLQAFDQMDKSLQTFVFERTKKCDLCKYCIQIDKTGKRPLANTEIDFDNNKYQLCNYYPGFSYAWSHLDDELVEMIIKMLSFIDGFIPN